MKKNCYKKEAPNKSLNSKETFMDRISRATKNRMKG